MNQYRFLASLISCWTALAVAVVPASARAQDKSAVDPTKLKLPQGPGALEGVGENADVNLSMGLLTYSVPVEVPSGYEGLTPSVGLSYSSGAGNSVTGMGWHLPLPSIERMTSKGLPEYSTADRFAADGGRELVRVGDEGVYRERFEGAFVRYRWQEADGGREGYWTAEYPDGRVGYFGARADGTPVSDARVEGSSGTFRYHLVEVVDPLGRRIVYDYDKDGEHPLLARIAYVWEAEGPRYEVRFSYEKRGDQLSDAKPGFEVRLMRRLAEIQVRVRGQQYRRYELSYSEAGGLSRLERVRWFGTDEARGAFPVAFTFGYSSGFGEACEGSECARVQSFGSVPLDFQARTADFVDLNGDALPDIVDTGADKHRFFLNELARGDAAFSEPITSSLGGLNLSGSGTQMLDLNGDGFADMVDADSGTVLFNAGNADWREQLVLSSLGMPDLGADANARPIDVDNDGRIDVLHASSAGTWYFRNDGDEFTLVEDGIDAVGAGFEEDGLRLADMNGDGLVDLVRLAEGLVSVRLNLGRGRWASWRDMDDVPPDTASFRLADINGDGLSDLVSVGGIDVTYALNDDSDRFSVPAVLAGSSSLPIPEMDGTTSLRFADMNGNGTTDVVWIGADGAISALEIFGHRPNLLIEIDNGIGWRIEVDYASSVEHLARDGGEWAHRLPHPMTVVDEMRTHDAYSGQVTVRQFRYRDGYFDHDEHQFRGFAEVETTEPGDESRETRVEQLVFDVGVDDRYRNALLLERRVFSESRPLYRVETKYDDCDVAGVTGALPSVRFLCPNRSTRVLQEGLEPSEWVTIEEHFEHDAYGNQTQVANLGVTSRGGKGCLACSKAPPGEPCGAQCTGDEIYEDLEFAVPGARWMVNRPIRKRTFGVPDSAETTEERYFYDGVPFVGLPFGKIDEGLLTRTTARVQRGDDDTIDVLRVRRGGHGAVVEQWDALGHRSFYAYDDAGLLLQSETAEVEDHALYMHVAYDPVLETIVRSSEWRIRRGGDLVTPERPTTYAYDAFGRLTAIAQPGDSLDAPTQVFEYEVAAPVSRIVRRSRSEREGELDLWEADCFDGLGRKLRTMTRLEAERFQVAEQVAYGSYGQEARLYEPFVTASGSCRAWPSGGVTAAPDDLPFSEHYFDAEGRVQLAILPDGDLFGTPSEKVTTYRPLEVIVQDEEDSSGGDHGNTPVREQSDGLGRPIARLQSLSDSHVVAMRYRYDELGRLETVIDRNGNEKSQTYDLLGRVLTSNDPDAGLTEYEYDAIGRRTVAEDARGVRRRFSFDALGRITAEWDEAAPEATRITFTYDDAPKCTACTHAAGRLIQIEYPLDGDRAKEQFGYDERGNPTNLVRTIDGLEFEFTSDYDNANRLRATTYPGEKKVEYERDGAGRAIEVKGFIHSATYAENGGLESITTRNGVRTKVAYDARKWVRSLRTTRQDDVLYSIDLTRDRVGNITRVEAEGGPEHLPTANAEYEFDALYRLRQAKLDPGSNFEETLEFDFDDNDNLLGKVSSHGDESPAHVGKYSLGEGDAGPNTVTTAGSRKLSYDAAGHLIGHGDEQLEWDFMGRLVTVLDNAQPRARYGYGPGRSRMKKVEGDHVTYYFGDEFEVRDGMATLGISIDGRRYAELEYPLAGPGLLDLAPASIDGAGLKPDPDGAYEARDAWFGQALRAGVFGGADPPADSKDASDAKAAAPSESSIRETLAASARRLVSDPGETGTRFLHHDHLGSVVLATDAEGQELARFLTYPFGVERLTTGGMPEAGRFTGQERDRSVGLVSFRSRPYDPWLGRWLRPDPLFVGDINQCVESPGDCNVFSYVQGNPIGALDPTGGQTVAEMIDDRAMASASAGNHLATYGWAFVGTAWNYLGAEGVSKVTDTILTGRDDLGAMDVASALVETTPAKVLKPLKGMAGTAMKWGGKKLDDAKGALSKWWNKAPCPFNSFAADTLVETAEGLRPIESIRVGDLVLAKDEVTGDVDWQPVVAVIRSEAKPILELVFEKESGGEEVILATPEHPIFVPGRGFVAAVDLALGDSMVSSEGELARLSAALSGDHEQPVYNLEVASYHTYFVGEARGWVHNCADAVKSLASSALQGAQLKRHLEQLQKYGKAGFKDLENGRIRYYGEVTKASKQGEMAGRRVVREWDPASNSTKTWMETVDHSGRVRIVRPETSGKKVHYMFDTEGSFTGTF